MKPYVTANKLASFITARSPARRRSIVRSLQRSAGTDFPQYYTSLREPARRFVTNGGSDTNELSRLIDKMAERTGTPWLTTDGRITSEATRALINCAPLIRALPYSPVAPAFRSKAIWTHTLVDVSVTPDVLIGLPEEQPSGALRLYVAKDKHYELGEAGAQLVATMMHLWQRAVLGSNADPTRCFVLECFQQRLTAAPTDVRLLEQLLCRGCEDFARLWQGFNDKEAA
jgi:hypothetical protein